MKEYIEREAALGEICRDCFAKSGCYCRILELPAADVVARDCYDRILAENDQMREQLASIGKKPGDSMDDVRKYESGVWENMILIPSGSIYGHTYGECSVCGKVRIVSDYCPNCGAQMKGGEDARPATE